MTAENDELTASQLAALDADLAELKEHVDRWLGERFGGSDSADRMKLEDVAGLLAWLRQWDDHFDRYDDSAAALEQAGYPEVGHRLAEIRHQIEVSIASFTALATTMPAPGSR